MFADSWRLLFPQSVLVPSSGFHGILAFLPVSLHQLFSSLFRADLKWNSASFTDFHKPSLLMPLCVADFCKVRGDRDYLQAEPQTIWHWLLDTPVFSHPLAPLTQETAHCHFSQQVPGLKVNTSPFSHPRLHNPESRGSWRYGSTTGVPCGLSMKSFNIMHIWHTWSLQTSWSTWQGPCGRRAFVFLHFQQLFYPNDPLSCFAEEWNAFPLSQIVLSYIAFKC